MSDGGRSAAWGFFFSMSGRLRLSWMSLTWTPCVLSMSRAEAPTEVGARLRALISSLVDHAGVTVAAVQVKGRGPDGFLGPAAVFRALSGMARDRDALRYELITNARLGESAVVLAEILRSGAGQVELRRRISEVLSAVGAGRAKAELLRLGEEELTRLGRGFVTVDPREDAEVHAALRTRLRRYRNDHRRGLGDASAGLMAGYLLSEIFAGAAYEGLAESPWLPSGRGCWQTAPRSEARCHAGTGAWSSGLSLDGRTFTAAAL